MHFGTEDCVLYFCCLGASRRNFVELKFAVMWHKADDVIVRAKLCFRFSSHAPQMFSSRATTAAATWPRGIDLLYVFYLCCVPTEVTARVWLLLMLLT